jgi:hypothetical protein
MEAPNDCFHILASKQLRGMLGYDWFFPVSQAQHQDYPD